MRFVTIYDKYMFDSDGRLCVSLYLGAATILVLISAVYVNSRIIHLLLLQKTNSNIFLNE